MPAGLSAERRAEQPRRPHLLPAAGTEPQTAWPPQGEAERVLAARGRQSGSVRPEGPGEPPVGEGQQAATLRPRSARLNGRAAGEGREGQMEANGPMVSSADAHAAPAVGWLRVRELGRRCRR